MILKCECRHEGQDEMYGKMMRVHNSTSDPEKFRCTVCGANRGDGGGSLKKTKKEDKEKNK